MIASKIQINNLTKFRSNIAHQFSKPYFRNLFYKNNLIQKFNYPNHIAKTELANLINYEQNNL
jgi:hypothetical protein